MTWMIARANMPGRSRRLIVSAPAGIERKRVDTLISVTEKSWWKNPELLKEREGKK
jgi:hypothetical protein